MERETGTDRTATAPTRSRKEPRNIEPRQRHEEERRQQKEDADQKDRVAEKDIQPGNRVRHI